MNLKYFKKYEIPFFKSKLIIFILSLPLISCFNNEIIRRTARLISARNG